MSYVKVRDWHGAKWDEPIIMELSEPGSRAILLPEADAETKAVTGDVSELLPGQLKRTDKPNLPELSQPMVVRHFLRLSQETMCQDMIIDLGMGTCTMKYSPKINEQFVRTPKFTELHPYQDVSTVQGLLKIVYDFEQMIKEISGLDAVCFQPGSGVMGIHANAAVMRKYFEERGETQRDQIITTVLSHPANAGGPHTKGFEVITLVPDEYGRYSLDQLKAVVSERTAGLFITNPEETGVFNPLIKDFVRIVHEAGGLVSIDLADYNGMFGLVRAKELGADMCQFNLHKSFASPHGCMGPGCAAECVKAEFEKYLPRPRVRFDGKQYYLDDDGPDSFGRVRQFYGSLGPVVRAYAWVRALGAEGLKMVGETSILNNHYMIDRVLSEVRGISLPWNRQDFGRMEQARYSFGELYQDTGVTSEDVEKRMHDFGFGRFFHSHESDLIAEPFTPEPNETYSKDDIDEFSAALKRISEESYSDPEIVRTAPHNATISQLDKEDVDDPMQLATTWRAYKKLHGHG